MYINNACNLISIHQKLSKETSDRFNVYWTFCTINDTKTYLKMNTDRHLKFIMIRFRMGISDIAVHHWGWLGGGGGGGEGGGDPL